jgi:hypothetical protein
MSILSRFPSKFLKGDDIEAGETVVVKEVRDELVGSTQEAKPVIYFREYDRGCILNKTNARSLVKVFGDDETSWPGKKVIMTTESTRNPSTGEPVEAIRLTPAPAEKKKKEAAEVTAALDDEIPGF